MSRFKIALGQMLVEDGEPENNLGRAAAMIARAAESGCDLVVLPECLNLGWTHPSARKKAAPIPGAHGSVLAQAAVEGGIWVAAGLVERAGERLYNAAVLISPAGEIVLRHRKINELKLAHDLYSQGTGIQVADTPLGRVGLLICADNFPDSLELGRALGRIGCRLLLSPCAWAVPAEHDNQREPYGGLWRSAYAQLTGDFAMTIVGVSYVGRMSAGPWAGRKVIGCSLAMGPGGEILAQAPYGEDAETLEMLAIEFGQESGPRVSALAASRV